MASGRIKSEEGSVEGFLLLIPLAVITSLSLTFLLIVFQRVTLVAAASSATRVMALDSTQIQSQVEALKKISERIGLTVSQVQVEPADGSGNLELKIDARSTLFSGLSIPFEASRWNLTLPFVSEAG